MPTGCLAGLGVSAGGLLQWTISVRVCEGHAQNDRASGPVIVNGPHASAHGRDKAFYQGKTDAGSAGSAR